MMASSHVSGSGRYRRGGEGDVMMMSVCQPDQRIANDGRRVWVPITGGMQENGRTKVVGWASVPRHMTMVPTRDVRKIPPSSTSPLQLADISGELPKMRLNDLNNAAQVKTILSVNKQSKLETRRRKDNNKQQTEFPPQTWNKHQRPTFMSRSSLRHDLLRPFTCDSTFTCQKCDVGQAVRLRSSTTSLSTHVTGARKSLLEESRKLEHFRNHPLLSAHQRIRKKTSKRCNDERPLMTKNSGDWFPLSFHGSGICGRKIKLDGNIADCVDVCYSLNDGFVGIKQSLHIGDSFEIQVQATDLRKDLFYVAVHKDSHDHAVAVHKKSYDHAVAVHKDSHDHTVAVHKDSHDHAVAVHKNSYDHAVAVHKDSHDHIVAVHKDSHDHAVAVHKNSYDHTVAVHKDAHDHTRNKLPRYCAAREWIYSDELTGLKAGDRISLQLDALGRIKCIINYNSPIVLFQMTSSAPCLIALCLGLGVKRLQLLGCSKRQKRLISPVNAYSISSRLTPTSRMSSSKSSFCSDHLPSGGSPLSL